MFGWKKKPTAPEPVSDPLERIKLAVDELNAAWSELDPATKIRPWMDWANREVILVSFGHSIEYRSGSQFTEPSYEEENDWRRDHSGYLG